MKQKLLCLIILIYFIFDLRAQNPRLNLESFSAKNTNKYQSNNLDSTALEFGVNNYKILNCYHDKNGKTTYDLDQVFYDIEGRIQQIVKYNDTIKQKINAQQVVISNPNHYSILEYYQNGKKGYKTIISYNDSNKMSQRSVYSLNNKLNYQTNYLYNDLGLLAMQTNYNHKFKERYHYEYYYFPNKKLKQSVLKNGKKTKTWDYTCDETGEIVKKSKDTIKICTPKTYQADGSIISVTSGYNWDGQPYKNVTITDSLLQLLSLKYYVGAKEELIYSRKINYHNNVMISSEYQSYNNGKMVYQYSVKQDMTGRITNFTSTTVAKKPKVTTYIYEYNANGFIVNKKTILNSILIKTQIYTYQYFK
jgi:hypothetical protein